LNEALVSPPVLEQITIARGPWSCDPGRRGMSSRRPDRGYRDSDCRRRRLRLRPTPSGRHRPRPWRRCRFPSAGRRRFGSWCA